MPPIATAREEPKAQEEKRGRRGRLWAVHVYGRNGVERKFGEGTFFTMKSVASF